LKNAKFIFAFAIFVAMIVLPVNQAVLALAAIPEPRSLFLLGTGLLLMALFGKRRHELAKARTFNTDESD